MAVEALGEGLRVVLGWGGGPEALQATEGEGEEREETFLRSLNLLWGRGWRGVGGAACPTMHPAAVVVVFLLPLSLTKQVQFITCIVCCLKEVIS